MTTYYKLLISLFAMSRSSGGLRAQRSLSDSDEYEVRSDCNINSHAALIVSSSTLRRLKAAVKVRRVAVGHGRILRILSSTKL